MNKAIDESTARSARQAVHPGVKLADGTVLPALGQGTWGMGEETSRRKQEIASLRYGVERGMTLIDTAEMYAEGQAETVVGEAIKGMRDQVFLVSKVYPHNAGQDRLQQSCEESLKRLGTDQLDLYLLHWRGNVPLAETVEGMENLVRQGKILRWGVSNFDTEDMKELFDCEGGTRCATNQVLYHLGSRGIEHDLLPWMRGQGMPAMAYSPLAQAGALRKGMTDNLTVRTLARKYGATPLQILLAWVIKDECMLAIPKASSTEHVAENAGAYEIQMSEEDIQTLDRAFPKPAWKVPLDVI